MEEQGEGGEGGEGRGRGRGVRGDRNTETNSIGKSYILYICRIFVNTYIHLQYGIVLDHQLMSNHSLSLLDQLSHYQVIQLSCLVSSLQRKLYVKLFLKLTAMLHNVWQQHGKQMRRHTLVYGIGERTRDT